MAHFLTNRNGWKGHRFESYGWMIVGKWRNYPITGLPHPRGTCFQRPSEASVVEFRRQLNSAFRVRDLVPPRVRVVGFQKK